MKKGSDLLKYDGDSALVSRTVQNSSYSRITSDKSTKQTTFREQEERRKCTHKWMEAFEPTFQKASHSMAKNTTMSRSTSNPNPETHSYEIGVVWRQARLFADTLLFFPFRSQTSNSFNIGEIFVSLCVTFRYVLGMCMNVFYDWCCFGITNRVIVKCIAFLFTWFNVNRCLKSRTVHAEKTTRYFEIHSVKWYVYQNNNESLTIKTKTNTNKN